MKKALLLLIVLTFNQSFSQNITATIGYQGYDESQEYFGEGEYQIFLDNIDGVLDKPIIMIDGFDPGDTRDIAMLYASLDIEGDNLADILRDEGFDFVALNAPLYNTDGKDIDGGSDYIQRNAMVLIELINFLNNEKVGDEELVIIGPSMGGLIARYGLSYMEENSMNLETRLYISFDSPHLGANIPMGFQYLINYFAKELDNAQAQAVVDNVLNSPAAKEMLLDHYLGHLQDGSDFEQDPNLLLPIGAPNFRNEFQTELDNLGFPQNVRNVSIINGSGQGTTIGSPGMEMINTVLDLGATIEADITLRFAPVAGATNTVTDFTTLVGGIPVASFDADAESFAFTDGVDSAPGGKSDIASGLGDISDPIIIAFLEALEQSEYCFIPTISAMAMSSEDNWYTNPSIENSPFVNAHIPSGNEYHVQLTPQNVAFALSEIRQTPLNNSDLENTNFRLIKNPVSDRIQIQINPNLLNQYLNVSIYNISGQLLFSEKIENTLNVLSINHNLNAGIYLLNITNNNQFYNTKILVK